MLVLKRRPHERIEIGDNITITVVWIQGLTVKLGIEAPDDVPVWRGEIAEQKRREKGASK